MNAGGTDALPDVVRDGVEMIYGKAYSTARIGCNEYSEKLFNVFAYGTTTAKT